MLSIKERLLNNIDANPINDCWKWNKCISSSGYGQIRINYKIRQAHRVSAMIFKNFDINSNLDVLHHCDNKLCINPKHLFIGTQKDNMKDCIKKGRHKRPNYYGEQHANAKLTIKQVQNIRKEYIPHIISTRKLAIKYGVSNVQIGNIIKRKQWRHT